LTLGKKVPKNFSGRPCGPPGRRRRRGGARARRARMCMVKRAPSGDGQDSAPLRGRSR
jgi:hypothetical protein